MYCRVWFAPPSVKVDSGQRAPRVAQNNPVRVDHWYQLDDVPIEYTIILVEVLREFLDYFAHNERAMGLCCVQPRLDVDNMLLSLLARPCIFSLRYGQLVDVQATHALGYDFLPVVKVACGNLEVMGKFFLYTSLFLILILNKKRLHLALSLILVLNELSLKL